MTTKLREAKHPVSRLAGPYGHPCIPSWSLCRSAPGWPASSSTSPPTCQASRPSLPRGAFWLIGLGLLGAAAAALLGFLDLFAIPTGTRAFRTGLLHMTLNLVVVAFYVGAFLLRQGRLEQADGVAVGLIILSAVVLGVLTVSGWLGGQLAYRYGVRVAEESTQAEAYQ
jgi:uncharacterized membrane protein